MSQASAIRRDKKTDLFHIPLSVSRVVARLNFPQLATRMFCAVLVVSPSPSLFTI